MPDPSDLYGLPLDRFVPERGALAKALRGEGRKDEAARVGALRKPSVAAWTVNQLVRTQRPAFASLFDAGDALERAQSELLAGRGDARALREAAQRERRVVDELAEIARGLLSSDGHEPTQATLDRVAATLHAAALDEEARARVREACLERELEQVGFGGSGAASATAPAGGERRRDRASGSGAKPRAAAQAATSAADDKRGAERDAERARAEQAERARAERERSERLKSARGAEADARRLAERAARHAEAAEVRRDRAADSLREAEASLAAARESAEAAAIAHERARQALDAL